MTGDVTLPAPTINARVAILDQLADIPEEEIWLAKQKSARTRRAYRLNVRHFMVALGITTTDQLRQADHRAVIAWERMMRETERAAPSTIRRRLSALSSMFKHLVRHGHAAKNPVREIERPAINRDEGTTPAFSKAQARKLLDAPADDTLEGLRDRAILSVGLQVGLRRAEIATLTVGDLHQNRGFDSLRVTRKGGRRDALAINPQTAARLRAYLERAGHADDIEGPLFLPLHHNGRQSHIRRPMHPDAIDRVLRKHLTHGAVPPVEAGQFRHGEAAFTAAPGRQAVHGQTEPGQVTERAREDGGPLAAGGCVGGGHLWNIERAFD
jgi:site-specific recombinase XerD